MRITIKRPTYYCILYKRQRTQLIISHKLFYINKYGNNQEIHHYKIATDLTFGVSDR